MTPSASEGRMVHAVAPAAGLLAWPLAWLFDTRLLTFVAGPAATVIPILLVASLTGGVVGIVASSKLEAGKEEASKHTTARAGFVTALVAAAVLVIRTTILHGERGEVAGSALVTLFHAVVTLLPATLFAMFAGGLSGAGRISIRGHPDTARPAFVFRPIHAIIITCALAFLSPFVPGFLSKPKPVVTISAPTPPPEPPPRFSYEKPAGFASAEGARVQLIARQEIREVDADAPMLITADGRRLVFLSERTTSPALVIFDLHAFEESLRLQLPAQPTALAWSPDGSRIAAILRSNEGRYLAIVIPADRRVISLPRPEGGEIPEGDLSWPLKDEVIIHPKGQFPFALNLDQLEYRPLDTAAFFTSLDSNKKAALRVPPSAPIGQTTKWTFDRTWTFATAGARYDNGKLELVTSATPGFAITDRTNGTRIHLRNLSIGSNDRVIFAPDGSKVIVARGSDAAIYYFGLRELPPLVRRLDMKKKVEDFPSHEMIRKQLEAGHLFAFIHPPVINPLNDKMVGSLSRPVKGIARFFSWDGTEATIVVQEAYTAIASGDVVSLLHTWENRELKELTEQSVPSWWATLGEESKTAQDTAAMTKVSAPMEMGPRLAVLPEAYGFRFSSADWSHGNNSRSLLTPRTESLPSEPPPLPPAIVPTPTNYAPILGQFIVRHHSLSSAGDVDGLIADYADRVEHFQAGEIPRSTVRAEELKYHAPGYRVTERVRGKIQFRRISPSRTEAKYELVFVRVKPDGSWASGASDVVLEIEMTTASPRIVKQNAVSRENEKQRGQNNPPSL